MHLSAWVKFGNSKIFCNLGWVDPIFCCMPDVRQVFPRMGVSCNCSSFRGNWSVDVRLLLVYAWLKSDSFPFILLLQFFKCFLFVIYLMLLQSHCFGSSRIVRVMQHLNYTFNKSDLDIQVIYVLSGFI